MACRSAFACQRHFSNLTYRTRGHILGASRGTLMRPIWSMSASQNATAEHRNQLGKRRVHGLCCLSTEISTILPNGHYHGINKFGKHFTRTMSGNAVEDEEQANKHNAVKASLETVEKPRRTPQIPFKFDIMSQENPLVQKRSLFISSIVYTGKQNGTDDNLDVNDDIEELAKYDITSDPGVAAPSNDNKKDGKVSTDDVQLLKKAKMEEKYWLHMYSNPDPKDNTVYPEAFKEHDEMTNSDPITSALPTNDK